MMRYSQTINTETNIWYGAKYEDSIKADRIDDEPETNKEREARLARQRKIDRQRKLKIVTDMCYA